MERRVELAQPVRAPVVTAGRVLADDAVAVFAPLSRAAGRRGRELVIDLGAHAPGGASAGHAVHLTLSAPRRMPGGGVVVGMSWEPAPRRRLLPAFEGELELVGDRHWSTLHLRGSYRPPLGPLGRLGDRVVGRRVARRTVADLLASLAGRLEAAAYRAAADAPLPAPYAPDLREPATEASSEHWIG